jgi:hypothetical protein
MVKRKINQQKKPFYISDSETVNAIWAQNFTDQLGRQYQRFNVSEDLKKKVEANNAVIQSVNQYDALLFDWQGLWRSVKNGLYNGSPSNGNPINFPQQPVFPDLPTAVGAYVLAPHIQVANIILADPTVTDADIKLFGLVKAEGKPKPPSTKQRDKAELYNYPVMNIKIENGVVVMRIVRGKRHKGKSVLVQVDREGKGNFALLANNTSANEVSDSIQLPNSQMTAAWAYRAIYMEGQTTISDWSPTQAVAVTKEPAPFDGPLQNTVTDNDGTDQPNS